MNSLISLFVAMVLFVAIFFSIIVAGGGSTIVDMDHVLYMVSEPFAGRTEIAVAILAATSYFAVVQSTARPKRIR